MLRVIENNMLLYIAIQDTVAYLVNSIGHALGTICMVVMLLHLDHKIVCRSLVTLMLVDLLSESVVSRNSCRLVRGHLADRTQFTFFN